MNKYFLFLIVVLFVNCAKTEYYLKNVNHGVRLTAYTEDEGYKMQRKFETSHTRVNLFWGILGVHNKDLDLILYSEFKYPEKEAIGNLVLTETYDFVDSFVDFATWGIVRLYSVKVRGEIYERISEPKINRESESSEILEDSKTTEAVKLPSEDNVNDPPKKNNSNKDGVKNVKKK